jgi:hypothetical protein
MRLMTTGYQTRSLIVQRRSKVSVVIGLAQPDGRRTLDLRKNKAMPYSADGFFRTQKKCPRRRFGLPGIFVGLA